MSSASTVPEASRKYDLGFARWVYENVEGGDMVASCMQCGVCSGSCPIGAEMDNGPRKTFMMIRAGMKEAVLTSDTLWNCVSCYNCVVRCPRHVPVTAILKSLATHAVAEGYAKQEDQPRFANAFWWSLSRYGKTDERLVTAKYYFSFGFIQGIKRGLANLPIALGMIKAKRMHIGAPHKIKKSKDLKAILAKAAEIEARDNAAGTSS